MQATFPKKEHLCGEIRINQLFAEGKAFINYPLRIVYLQDPKPAESTVRVMFSVPKKRFKRAVKRNRLKRLMRETYRLNKQLIVEKCIEQNIHLLVAFHYVSDDEVDFHKMEEKMTQALKKIAERL